MAYNNFLGTMMGKQDGNHKELIVFIIGVVGIILIVAAEEIGKRLLKKGEESME